MMRIYWWALLFEAVAMASAVTLFRCIEPKAFAAIFAGGTLVVLGVVIVGWGAFAPQFRSSWTYRIGWIHLALVSAPMMVVRLIHYREDFREIRIFGMRGPIFHHVSEAIYTALIIGTTVDLWRSRQRRQADMRETPRLESPSAPRRS